MAKHKQSLIRKILQNLLFLLNHHRQSTKPNVLIFSLPRSGSTWLQELIWTQPGFKYANEPLNLKGEWMQKKVKIRGFSELYTEEARKKVITYFKGIVDGKLHFLNPNPLRKHTKLITSRIVFKVIHGGEVFINDIAKNTHSKVVYLIRHPIAVALSRKQIPRTKELTSDFVLSRFTTQEKDYARKLMNEGNDMEKLVLLWCIQNKLALQQRTDDWLILSYENLTCKPYETLSELARHCELPKPETMFKSIDKPSAVTTQSEKDSVNLMKDSAQNRKSLISKWRSKVTMQEKERYFEICRQMNIRLYEDHTDFPVAENIS